MTACRRGLFMIVIATRDEQVFEDVMSRLSQEDEKIYGRMTALSEKLEAEHAEREEGVNRTVGEAALLRGALDAAIGEWRDANQADRKHARAEVRTLTTHSTW